jgi:hypothetical protein
MVGFGYPYYTLEWPDFIPGEGEKRVLNLKFFYRMGSVYIRRILGDKNGSLSRVLLIGESRARHTRLSLRRRRREIFLLDTV